MSGPVERKSAESSIAMAQTRIDLTGKIFGRLTVVSRSENNKHRQPTWLCKCACGSEKVIAGSKLKYGQVKSCGCLLRELRHKSRRERPEFA
jgi:hypothetical protein